MTTWWAMLAALAAGYLVGRLRPWDALRERSWRWVVWGALPTNAVGAWAAVIAFAVTHPAQFVRALRGRRNPAPEPYVVRMPERTPDA